ncbi:MAG: sulfatase [Candidatus Hydrogenedentes bacterium]|nr:sulfatase [Candidatus Hydrogenedentota bacterium]
MGTAFAASALGYAGCATPRGASSRPPNIVYIMSDDHAAHAISCYGSVINKTPNIDRVAAGGMRLDNCFCTNSLCAPSRAAILTGKYSHINGLRTNADTFDGSQQTYPKLLQRNGYQTAMIGKWHLVSDPTGFDYWNILPGQGAYYDPMLIEMGQKTKHQGYVTDIITRSSIELLEKRDKSRPFCLISQHKAPHRPWSPDAAHANLYEGVDIPEPATFKDDYSNRGHAAHEADMRVASKLDHTDLKVEPPAGLAGDALAHWKYERYIKDYLRVIASLDDNIGRLLDYLDKEGLTEDTIVVYTADNGFFLGDHGWFDKRFMYEESLRMPFLMRYPREIAAGSTDSHMALNIDFAPTMLDFAGLPVPSDMQGRSLRPVVCGKAPANWRKSMYYQYYEYPIAHAVRPHYGVRSMDFKLIHYLGGTPNPIDEWEMFDLRKDPQEMRSVYADPAYAIERAKLTAELERLRKDVRAVD